MISPSQRPLPDNTQHSQLTHPCPRWDFFYPQSPLILSYSHQAFISVQMNYRCGKLNPLHMQQINFIARAEPDDTRAETRFRLSPKRTSPFKSVGASVQSTAGSRGVRISLSNAGYTTFGGGLRVLATHSIRQFPLHFPSLASPCATRFRTSSTAL